MAKLKSFEEYIADVDSAEEIENAELAMAEPTELDDEETVSSDDQDSGGELDTVGVDGEEAGEEAEDMEADTTPGEEDEYINGEEVDSEPKDISAEIEDQMEDPENFDNEKVEESELNEKINASGYIKAGKLGYNDQFLGRKSLAYTLSVDLGLDPKNEFVGPWLGFDHVSFYITGKNGGTILDDGLAGKYTYDDLKDAAKDFLGMNESAQNEAEKDSDEESKAVADMLKEVYEACKNEAKTWEADMHDEHTLESYMKENAALVATLAMDALKEMKEDMTLEMYEAACEELKESYAKKMDELKEAWTAEGEEVETEEAEKEEE